MSKELDSRGTAKYQANRLTVTRQLPYDPSSSKTVDVGLFLDGIPVAAEQVFMTTRLPDLFQHSAGSGKSNTTEAARCVGPAASG